MALFCHRVGKVSVRISIVRSEKIGILALLFMRICDSIVFLFWGMCNVVFWGQKIVLEKRDQIYCATYFNRLSNKMDNSLLAVRNINHKYIVVKRG